MYAESTTVPVEKTRAEIEGLLIRYGATSFQTGWNEDKAMIAFKLREYTIKFILPIPGLDDPAFKRKRRRGGWVNNTPLQIERLREQEVRRRWRALKIVVQAKLEAVECKISTLVNEFMAFIVLPNSETLGDWVLSHALPAIQGGVMPKMLEMGQPRTVTDNS